MAQMKLVKDIRPGTDNSLPDNFMEFNGSLYFKANDGNTGNELWKTDGTTEGTVLVKDINSGTDHSTPGNFFEFNNQLYFSANNGGTSVLHKTDGTADGTVDLGLGVGAFWPQIVGDKVFFINTTAGNKLYTFDGTTVDAAANASTSDENIPGGNFIPYNGKLLLYMNYEQDDATVGMELYEYEPATATYTLIKDITGDDGNAGISNFTALDSKVYFEAEGNLWKTDGTLDGTTSISTTVSGVNNLYAWDGKLFFEGDDGSDDQLWVYNPTD